MEQNLKTDIAERVLIKLMVVSPTNPDSSPYVDQVLTVMETVAADLEANGVRVGWIEAYDILQYPGQDEGGIMQYSGLPNGLIKAFVDLVSAEYFSEIYPELPVPANIARGARIAPQTLMKFEWEQNTPKLRMRAGSPIGSGNTKYRYVNNSAPKVENIDVENNTTLGDLTLN